MPVVELKIEGMSCQNCVRHATEAIQSVDGVTLAEVTLSPGAARVEHEGADVEAILRALSEEGYPSEVR